MDFNVIFHVTTLNENKPFPTPITAENLRNLSISDRDHMENIST